MSACGPDDEEARAAGLEWASTDAKSEASEDSDQVGVLGPAATVAVSVLTVKGSVPRCCCGSLRLSQWLSRPGPFLAGWSISLEGLTAGSGLASACIFRKENQTQLTLSNDGEG